MEFEPRTSRLGICLRLTLSPSRTTTKDSRGRSFGNDFTLALDWFQTVLRDVFPQKLAQNRMPTSGGYQTTERPGSWQYWLDRRFLPTEDYDIGNDEQAILATAMRNEWEESTAGDVGRHLKSRFKSNQERRERTLSSLWGVA